MNIVITGSIAFDYLMTFPGDFTEAVQPNKLHKLSVSFLVDEMRKQRGGCAANIAFSLAMLGERPLLMGTVGEDFVAYRAWLNAHGVDTSATRVISDVFTASFFATTDRHQNQIASFYTGAMAYANELSFHDLPQPVDLAIISPNDPQAMDKYPAECRELQIPYIYDPSQQVVRSTPEELRRGLVGAEIFIVNDYEFEIFKERTGMSEDEIRRSVKRAVLVTLGEKGAMIWENERLTVPAVPPQQILDPTGVGDAFRAGLLKGLALGLPLEICGRIGSLAATYVLETHGPQAHHYTLAEFTNRYREAFGEDAFTASIQQTKE